jgi:hypothetical protein
MAGADYYGPGPSRSGEQISWSKIISAKYSAAAVVRL